MRSSVLGRCSGPGELLDSISCILNITAKDLMKAAEIGELLFYGSYLHRRRPGQRGVLRRGIRAHYERVVNAVLRSVIIRKLLAQLPRSTAETPPELDSSCHRVDLRLQFLPCRAAGLVSGRMEPSISVHIRRIEGKAMSVSEAVRDLVDMA